MLTVKGFWFTICIFALSSLNKNIWARLVLTAMCSLCKHVVRCGYGTLILILKQQKASITTPWLPNTKY